MPMAEPTDELSPTHLLFVLIGAGLMVVVGLFVFASVLIAPLWAVTLMGAVWLAAGVWALRRWRRSMFSPLLASLIVGLVWIVVINVGDAVFDWSA
jgi:uncharacterized membrane protein HdeD (DUF308 family)